jgi:hypothetical protein
MAKKTTDGDSTKVDSQVATASPVTPGTEAPDSTATDGAKASKPSQGAQTNGNAADGAVQDPFDPAALRLRGDTVDSIGAEQPLLRVPVQKPPRHAFFRANPDSALILPAHIIDMKEEREVYLVTPEMALALPGETKPIELRVCITRQGMVFLWPVPMPSDDGRRIPWYDTARKIVKEAETVWCRMIPNMQAGHYDVLTSKHIPDPVWPPHSLKNLLRIAFGDDRLVDREDHPIVRQLLGQA